MSATAPMPERVVPFPIVSVCWIDSSRYDGWVDLRDVVEFAQNPSELDCESIGYLLQDREDRIVLAHSATGDSALGVLAIPKVAITSFELIEDVIDFERKHGVTTPIVARRRGKAAVK